MKKILFGTTALAAIGLLAGGVQAADQTNGPIQISIGGYFYGFLQGVNQSNGQGHKNDAITDKSRLSFQGKATLDNGLKAGFVINLRGESETETASLLSADQVDDHFVYLDSATYGRVELGATSSAPRKMFYGASTPLQPASGLNSPNFLWFANTGNPLFQPTSLIDFGDADKATKITYFTPRVAGFQLGVSFAPSNCVQNEEEELGNGNNSSAGWGGNTTASSCIFFGATPLKDEVARQDNIVEAALNYVGNFNGVGVGAYVGGGHASLSAPAINGATLRDLEQYGGGLNVSYAGFSLGASLKYDNNGTSDGTSATSPLPTDRWDGSVGLTYTTGPWSIGATYAYAQDKEVNNTGMDLGKDKLNAQAIGVNYVLGPGINLNGGVEHLDYTGYPGSVGYADKGFLYTVGTVLNF